jgi:hypothetical protein
MGKKRYGRSRKSLPILPVAGGLITLGMMVLGKNGALGQADNAAHYMKTGQWSSVGICLVREAKTFSNWMPLGVGVGGSIVIRKFAGTRVPIARGLTVA